MPLVPVEPFTPMEPVEPMVLRSGKDASTFSVEKQKKRRRGPKLQIENFPDELHRKIKSKAADKGLDIKELVEQVLRYALANDHIIVGKPLVVDSGSESEQGSVWRSSAPDAPEASAKDIRGKSQPTGKH